MRRYEEPEAPNMTPMIDIVFQMIIFFICTIDLDAKKFDPTIQLEMAEHGRPVQKLDPQTIWVEIADGGEGKGIYKVGNTRVNEQVLLNMFKIASRRHSIHTPVVIRGDRAILHESVADVMKLVGQGGLYRVEIAAIKEKQ